MKKYLRLKSVPIGMYFTDAASLGYGKGCAPYWLSSKDMPYLPVLNWIQFNDDAEVRLASGETIGKDITTYNENQRLNRLSDSILTRSKLNVTTNDLFVGPVRIALNFTNKHVTITSSSGLAKCFSPLENSGFSQFDGRLLILEIHTLNSIDRIHELYGYTNYLKTLRDRCAGRSDLAAQEITNVYDYVLTHLTANKALTSGVRTDTYKVATMLDVPVLEMLEHGSSKVLSVLSKDLEITLEDIVAAPMHDRLAQDYVTDRSVMETIRGHGLSCFLVDNHDKLSDRFINFAGMVRKVPKIKSNDKIDGLYITSIDASQHLTVDAVTPLEEIDKMRYIYKSIEEAESGADMRVQYSDQLELQKLDKANESMGLKGDHEQRLREHDLLMRQRAAELETAAREQALDFDARKRALEMEASAHKARLDAEAVQRKAEHEAFMQQLKQTAESQKQESERLKHQYDRSHMQMSNESLYVKRDYEHAKYERDSTVETIKTVGAVAGLLAGGYAIYSKFSH